MNLATPPITPTHWTEIGEMPEDLIVACVCWGNKYPDSYVQKLKRAVERNLHWPHEFVCLSDREIDGVKCKPLFMAEESWWHKVQLFAPSMFREGARVLYLDLDLVLVNDIATLAAMEFEQPLAMIFNFGPNRRHAAHNSSVMVWTAGDERVYDIFNLFTSDVPKRLHGDQCWIWRVLKDDIANFPREYIVSYKYDVRPLGDKLPMGSRVVVFHGDPKPDDLNAVWVKANWY